MIKFVLQNADGRYFSKDLDWIDELKTSAIFCYEHQDQALNKLVELNAKDINLRAQVIACDSPNGGKLAPIAFSSSAA
ncbi:hypothetical protein N9I32_04480 [Porticoccaceae bacterium]|jgi:hypothetical protein|nr:hypothetical protein [Porticoccaceae bacterium]